MEPTVISTFSLILALAVLAEKTIVLWKITQVIDEITRESRQLRGQLKENQKAITVRLEKARWTA